MYRLWLGTGKVSPRHKMGIFLLCCWVWHISSVPISSSSIYHCHTTHTTPGLVGGWATLTRLGDSALTTTVSLVVGGVIFHNLYMSSPKALSDIILIHVNSWKPQEQQGWRRWWWDVVPDQISYGSLLWCDIICYVLCYHHHNNVLGEPYATNQMLLGRRRHHLNTASE